MKVLGRRDLMCLSTAVVMGIKLYMMLQNSFFLSSKACSLGRAKEVAKILVAKLKSEHERRRREAT